MREEAGRSVFEDGRKHLPRLNIAQRRRVAGGDPQPIDDLRDEKSREREEEVRKTTERRRIAEENDRANNDFYQKMIAPTGSNGSSNGKQPNFK